MRLLNRLAILMVIPLASCAVGPSSPSDTGFGASPALPAPESSLIPMVNIAPVQARPDGFIPTAPAGFLVTEFAGGLAHSRWLYTLPNGDVLVAESDAPKEHDEGSGLFGWVRKQVMKRAGAGVPSPDRIVLLRDADGSGVARTQTVFLRDLHSPFGMALIGNQLYVADTDALLRFDYVTGTTQITSPASRLPTCRPGRSTITGPKISWPTAQASICTSRWDRTATQGKMESGPKTAERESSCLTSTRAMCGPM
jgi:glucose/arabinose dehydrogenase